jgi:CRP/FNR family transcriptional regulator, cyclic AMP receptor protein
VFVSKVALLRNVPFFAGLPDEPLERLAGRLGRRTFAKGMILFHQGAIGQRLYIIESGAVRIFLLSEAGQEVTVNVYGLGEVFGELAVLDGLPRSAGAVVMEKTVTLTLHRNDFLEFLAAYPAMARSIIELLSTRLRYTTAYAESLSFLDVQGRVAAKLLELATRYGRPQERGTSIALGLTQAELATWVSATRESVNRVLSNFRDQGLIDLDGPLLLIRDRQALERRITF